MLSTADELELLRRGLAEELPVGGLAEKLTEAREAGRPLRVKLGVDPTASRVHLGWAVVLRKLRQFQECGHTAVLIVGDFTAQVGDPSGKSQTRKRLGRAEVETHAAACIGALQQVLLADRLEIRFNSEWLGAMGMTDVLELATHVTVAQLLEREDFRNRFRANRPISLIEFLYPLLQAADSVAVEADIELGGTDQTFNNLMGRQLQRQKGQAGQVVCTVPLLVGTDGTEKMSQSLGNFVAVDEAPNEMFGKLMSVPDHLIVDYSRLAAWMPTAQADELAAGLAEGSLHPNAAKRLMASAVVELYHGEGSGQAAEAAFDRQFKEHRVPEAVPEHDVPPEPLAAPQLVADTFGISRGEARRLMSQGGVKLGGVALVDVDRLLGADELEGRVLQVGKRRFAKFVRVV